VTLGKDIIYLGPCPADEEAAQSVDADFAARNKAECLLYIQAIKRKLGEPPDGAVLKIKTENHEFGPYREVVCEVDSNNEAAVQWAYMAEDKAPTTWAEVGITPPRVQGNGRSR